MCDAGPLDSRAIRVAEAVPHGVAFDAKTGPGVVITVPDDARHARSKKEGRPDFMLQDDCGYYSQQPRRPRRQRQ